MRIKDYLSFSQFSLFKLSPERYKRVYIDGIRMKSKYMDFGSKIATALETAVAKDSDDKLAIKLLPKAQEHEREFLVKFEGIPLFGKLDGFTKKNELIIDEHKTGKNKWTQVMVNNSEQLTFYAIMVSKFYSTPIESIRIRLHWIETFEDTDGAIHLTGQMLTFETRRTMRDLLNIYPEIKKVWEGIEQLIDNLCNL